MDPLTIIAIVQAVAKLAGVLGPLVHQVKDTMSETDQKKLQEALVQLASANDVLYDHVQQRLAEASKKS